MTPISLTIGIAFKRRERALIEIAKFRSFAFQLFLAHSLWDWDVDGKDQGRKGVAKMDWVGHADDVLTELVAMGDELCRFLTMPTSSRSRYDVLYQLAQTKMKLSFLACPSLHYILTQASSYKNRKTRSSSYCRSSL